MEYVEAKEYEKNPVLSELVEPNNDLKNMLVEYVGEKLNPKNDEVTVEMIVEAMAKEFPEFVLPIAEENFIRGYQQAMMDDPDGLAQAMMDITHQTHQHEIDLQTKDEEA